MTPERLKTLAEAYGGDVRRWPDADRAAAQRVDRDVLERALFEARQLDAVLDMAPRATVSHALRERVLAQAAGAGLRVRPRRFSLDPLTWLSGAGVAAACAAGVLFGVSATLDASADARADAVLYQASLAGVDDLEVLG